MGSFTPKLKFIFLFLFCSIALARNVKTIGILRIKIISPNQYSNLNQLETPKPQDFTEQDAFYRFYFSAHDDGIKSSYQSEWAYHEEQKGYELTRNQNFRRVKGALNYSERANSQDELHRTLAKGILRMRIEGAIRAQINKKKDSILNRALSTFDGMKNYTIKIEDKNETNATTSEFRMGYDVVSDNSNLSFTKGQFEAGLNTPLLFTTFGRDLVQKTSFYFATDTLKDFPRLSVTGPLNLTSLQSTFSKALSETVDGSFTMNRPFINSTGNVSYQATVSYRF